MPHSIVRNWRWAAVPFGVLYLILLALRFRGIMTSTNLDADAVSAPVIGELFGSAPSSAHVVLGEFAWYATLLFELEGSAIAYVLGINAQREMGPARRLIEQRVPVDPAELADPAKPLNAMLKAKA